MSIVRQTSFPPTGVQPVDQRAIIPQRVRNVVLMFNDIGQVLQMTDHWVTKRNALWSICGNVVTWDTTARLVGSSSWLYQWFGRGYSASPGPTGSRGSPFTSLRSGRPR